MKSESFKKPQVFCHRHQNSFMLKNPMTFFNETWLNQTPLFKFLEPNEAKELLKNFENMSFAEGETIFDFGDSGNCLYLVVSGHVELSIRDHTGQKIILKVAEPGEIFGELSLLDHGPRTATAIALETSQLACLGREDLINFLKQKPEASIHLLSALGTQIRQTNNLVRARVAKNANEEIADELGWTQKMANRITELAGSMSFLLANLIIFLVWIVVNLGLIPKLIPFDPYPFGLLTTGVSLEAIFLSIVVLLSQNLQATKDRVRADIEYEVNLKAEMEIGYLHEKVDQMNAVLLRSEERR